MTDQNDQAVLPQSPQATQPPAQSPAGRVAAGAVLIIVGVLLGLKKLDIMTSDPFHQLWPLALIVIGAGKLWGQARELSGFGLWLVLAGLWFLAVNLQVFGPARHLTGPVILVITGLVLVLSSFDEGRAVRAR